MDSVPEVCLYGKVNSLFMLPYHLSAQRETITKTTFYHYKKLRKFLCQYFIKYILKVLEIKPNNCHFLVV